MKSVLALFLFLSTVFAAAQGVTNPNGWINYAQKYYKIKVAKNALYRVPYSTLQQYDIPLEGSQLAMYYKGQQIPIYVSTEGTLNTTDYVEFVGQQNDGEFDRQLYVYETWQPAPERNLFSDTSAYYLTAQPAPNLHYQNTPNNLTGAPPPETYFWHTLINSPQNVFYEGKPISVAGISRNFADFEDGEGYVSTDIINNSSQNFTLPTRDIYPLNDSATVKANILARSNDPDVFTDHHLRLSLGSTVYADEQNEGYRSKLFTFNVPIASLTNPSTAITVASVDMGDDIVNRQAVGYISINYPHAYSFSNAKSFLFEVDNNGAKYIEMSAFNGGTNAVLYDLTNGLRLVPIVENSLYKFMLPAGTSTAAKRKLFVVNTTGMCDIGTTGNPNCNLNAYTIPNMQPLQFTDFTQTANQGNYIILTHPKLSQTVDGIDQVERYRQYRSSAAGGSYNVIVVNIEELYDQFAWGIEKHPMAIRNFINYAFANQTQDPEYLLLLGKSVGYSYFKLTDSGILGYNQCLVPSYGSVASDEMLGAAYLASFTPRVAIGRLPMRTGNDVKIYLDKLITYEANNDPTICSKTDRLWMKDALHIAGGYSLAESNEFLSNLDAYKTIYQDTSFAGRVVLTYNKLSEQSISDADLKTYIENGLGIITFFGHSSGEVLNVDINDPSIYNNQDRYPFVITGSCSVGDVHNYYNAPTTLPERYVMIPNKGSIGWLGSASIGFPTYLYAYLSRFYTNFCRTNYNKPVGYCLKKTIEKMNSDYPNDNVAKLTAQEYTLTGDPAVILNSWEKPEYVIESSDTYSDLTLVPTNVTADLDSFAVRLTIANVGRAVSDSFNIRIVRTLPDGTTQTYNHRIPSTVYADTLLFYIPTGDPFVAAGENQLQISVDADNELPEDCENNNQLSQTFVIFSDLLIPIAPCNFAIVHQTPITLYASTGQPLLPAYDYKIQIDTTELFNSPALHQTIINSVAGVVTYTPTNIAWQNNTVYYWRTARVPNTPNQERWKSSSFIYLADGSEGWNQSHYYQYLNHNTFQNLSIDTTRTFVYPSTNNTLLAINNRQPESSSHIQYSLNGTVYQQNTCLKNDCKNGIAIALFKPNATLTPQYSENTNGGFACAGVGTYGNVQCGFDPTAIFEFKLQNNNDFIALKNFVQNIPQGYYVLAYNVGNHHLNVDATNINLPAIYSFFIDMGANQVVNLDTLSSFIVFGRKGIDNSAQVVISTSPNQDFELNTNIQTVATNGSISSPLIGPATAWHNIEWQTHAQEINTNDQWQLKVFGVKEGNETLLYDLNTSPQNISSVDAAQYPFLRLEAHTTDTTNFTPPQIDFWRVLFKRSPEAALNQANFFVFYSDTLQEGEMLQLQMGVTNPEANPMDSLQIAYIIRKDNGQIINTNYPKQAPIGAGQTIISNFTYPTTGLVGNNLLAVELNPNQAQPEKFKFNNIMYLPFVVVTDKINPILDVTFDGRHIVDGELIAPQPEVQIRLKDENKYLALNDTANVRLWLISSDTLGFVSLEQPLYFNNPQVQFVPPTAADAANGKNSATITYRPNLNSGVYALKVLATDRSSNTFAKKAYQIGFMVDTKPAISNLLNYPNPFTTSTRFVFKLSGVTVPQNLKIQIMTVTGRVVREITQAELGTLHIGNNLTDFAWDGTDQFGSPLANGLYLYRVVSKLDGQTMDKYQSGADKWTENGLGKMYLVR